MLRQRRFQVVPATLVVLVAEMGMSRVRHHQVLQGARRAGRRGSKMLSVGAPEVVRDDWKDDLSK